MMDTMTDDEERRTGLTPVRIAWEMMACERESGDLACVFPLGVDCLGLYVLDVCGHGSRSADYARLLHEEILQAADGTSVPGGEPVDQVRPGLASPQEVVTALNQRFPMVPPSNQYFTMVYGTLDLRTGRFAYTTAGHPGPICVRRDGRAETSPCLGVAVGFFEEAIYNNQQLTLKPGDRLFLYSDGLLEAGLEQETGMLGEEQLRELLRGARGSTVQDAVDRVCAVVRKQCGRAGLTDDVCILALEYG